MTTDSLEISGQNALSWDLTFTNPELERRFCSSLARENHYQSLFTHLLYATCVKLANALRAIQRSSAPAASSSSATWSCEEQKTAGAVLRDYPCDGSTGKQLRHVLANVRFYYLQRDAHLHDWGFLANDLAMLLVALALLLLAASGADQRPAGRSWRAWLAWRGAALTVTPLHWWAIVLPATLVLAGPARWWQLGSYQVLAAALWRPVWDTAVVALLMGGLRLRFKTMASVGLIRAFAVSVLGAYVEAQDVAVASGSDLASNAASAPPTVPPMLPWLLRSLRHLAVLLPLACVPIAYWWCSERAMRMRFLARTAAAAAATAASATASNDVTAAEAIACGGTAAAAATGGSPDVKPSSPSPATTPFGTGPTGIAGRIRFSGPLRSGDGGSASSSASVSGAAAAISPVTPRTPFALPSEGSSGALCSQAPDLRLSSMLSTADSIVSADSRAGVAFAVFDGMVLDGAAEDGHGGGGGAALAGLEVSELPPTPEFDSAESARSWLSAADFGLDGDGSGGGECQGFEDMISPFDDARARLAQPSRFGGGGGLGSGVPPLPAAAATEEAGSFWCRGAGAMGRTGGPLTAPLRGTLRPFAMQFAPSRLGAGGAAVSASHGGPLPPALRYRGITTMQTFSIKVHHPTGSHEDYAARLSAAVAPLLFPPASALPALLPAPVPALPSPPPAAAGQSPFAAAAAGTALVPAEAASTAAPPGCASPCRQGGLVVVEGCVQLIAWVRGVDGTLTQRVVELNEQLAAALGLDANAVAALMQQQQAQDGQQQRQQAPQALPQLAEGTQGLQLVQAQLPAASGSLGSTGVTLSGAGGGGGGGSLLDSGSELVLQQVTPELELITGRDSASLGAAGARLPSLGSAGWPSAAGYTFPAAPSQLSQPSAQLPPPQQQTQQAQQAQSPLPSQSLQGLMPPFTDLQQALVQLLPDASNVGPWSVQGPMGQFQAYCNQQQQHQPPSPQQMPASSAPSPSSAMATTQPSNGAAPPSFPAGLQLSAPSADGGSGGNALAPADSAADFGGPITIECAWTPCVPIAPENSPPIELELGLTSAVSQSLRLLLVQHGVLLADFTCVLGQGPQVLMLPVPPQPSPSVLQLVFAPAAGAATPSSPLLYDIATLLAVPAEVAAELAQLSQVMRMEYGSAAAAAASSSGAAWRDHYAPLISDLAYLMERAELAAATRAAAAGAAAGEVSALAAMAAADGPAAVLRVAQQLIQYLDANGMPASAQFVVRTAQEALQLHVMLAGNANAASGAAAAPAVAAPVSVPRIMPAAGAAAAAPAAAALAAPPSREASPRAAVAGLFSPFAAATGSPFGGRTQGEEEEGSDDGNDWHDCRQGSEAEEQFEDAAAALPRPTPTLAQEQEQEQQQPYKLPAGLPSPFQAAMAPWPSTSEDDGAEEAGGVEEVASVGSEPPMKLPAGLPSPFSAAMQPWPSTSDDAGPEANDGFAQAAAGGSEPPMKLPAGLPSPFAAAMQPWPSRDEDEVESSVDASLRQQQSESEPPIKLPAGLPSPFAAAMEPWPSRDEDSTPAEAEVGTGADAIKLPAGLPTPFSAAMAPWPSSTEEEEEEAEAQPATEQPLKLPAGLPSPFAAAMQPWPSTSDEEDEAEAGVTAPVVEADEQPLKLPASLPSPFAAAAAATTAPWEEAEEQHDGGSDADVGPAPDHVAGQWGSGSTASGGARSGGLHVEATAAGSAGSGASEPELEMKLPKGLPSPFSAAMQPWGSDEAEDEPPEQSLPVLDNSPRPDSVTSSKASSKEGDGESAIKLPAQLYSPFAAAMAPWPSSTEEDDAAEPQQRTSAAAAQPMAQEPLAAQPEEDALVEAPAADLASPFSTAMAPSEASEASSPAGAEAAAAACAVPAASSSTTTSPFALVATLASFGDGSVDTGGSAAEADETTGDSAEADARQRAHGGGRRRHHRGPTAAHIAAAAATRGAGRAASSCSGRVSAALHSYGTNTSPFSGRTTGEVPFLYDMGMTTVHAAPSAAASAVPEALEQLRPLGDRESEDGLAAGQRHAASDIACAPAVGRSSRRSVEASASWRSHSRPRLAPAFSHAGELPSRHAGEGLSSVNVSMRASCLTASPPFTPPHSSHLHPLAPGTVSDQTPLETEAGWGRTGAGAAASSPSRRTRLSGRPSISDSGAAQLLRQRSSAQPRPRAQTVSDSGRAIRQPSPRGSGQLPPPSGDGGAAAGDASGLGGAADAGAGDASPRKAAASALACWGAASLKAAHLLPTLKSVECSSGSEDTDAAAVTGGVCCSDSSTGSGDDAGGPRAAASIQQYRAMMSGGRILQALEDCCIGYHDPRVVSTASQHCDANGVPTAGALATGREGVVGAEGISGNGIRSRIWVGPFGYLRGRGGRSREARYGLYHARQALALDGYTLAYICAKTVVCLLIPYIVYGTIDRHELLLVGPHLLLRVLSFAPKAIVLLLAAWSRVAAMLGLAPPPPRRAVGWRGRHAPAPDPQWAVAWREVWVLGCGYAELALLALPMALGLLPPPGSLVQRLRGVGLEVLMDGIQRNAFDQVRTRHRLPQHTLHCALIYALAAHQLALPHAAARAALIWLAGFVTCLVVEVPRRVDYAVLHCPGSGIGSGFGAVPPGGVPAVPVGAVQVGTGFDGARAVAEAPAGGVDVARGAGQEVAAGGGGNRGAGDRA